MASDGADLARQLDSELLGGHRRWTRGQAAARAGMSVDQTGQVWNALGFATVADDEVAFTDQDVTALRNAHQLMAAGLIDEDRLLSVTRMMGQSMSRLAEWQSRLLVELLVDKPDAVPGGDLVGFVGEITPALEQIQLHIWRRHLAAAAQRLLTGGYADGSTRLVVGFVDLAGYTSLSRQLDSAELFEVLEEFETTAAELAVEFDIRIVKTIGDEVLFVGADAEHTARLALGLLDRTAASDRLPPARAGLAAGSVLSRFGDVYGPVVNIASRLTGLARPGTALVDRELAADLDRVPDFELRRLRPIPVRGYHHLAAARLRRRPTG